MKTIMVAIAFLFGLVACNKTQLTPVQGVVCAVEQTVATDLSGTIATALQCSNTAAISASLTTALGNANLCLTPIPAPAPTPGAPASLMSKPQWGTIGDVSKGDLDKSKKPQIEKPKGIVGVIACPIIINVLTGFASNSVPSEWGCKGPNTSIQGLIQTLTTACATAIPI